MNYKLSLGAWGSVFAVPDELVDKHLRLAGAVQLKVILYFLRHAGEDISVETIASALMMQEADVRDCMLYWEQTGLVSVCDGIMKPGESEPAVEKTEPEEVNEPEKPAQPQPAQPTHSQEQKKPSRALSRPEKPTPDYLARRLSENPDIAYLMQTADEIFGRLTSMSDKSTLLMIHETDGLPVDVIIMLLQYAADIDKCNIRYIEKTAIAWADEEINTLERAEKKIQRLTSGRSAAAVVQRVFGIDAHSPTEKETDYADRWINEWGFSQEMLRKAYEICVDIKQKYIPKYVDTILSRWYSSGIKTPEQAMQDQSRSKVTKPKKTYAAAYDISDYESSSITDEE